MSQLGQWMEQAWASIMDDELHSAMLFKMRCNIGKGFYSVLVNRNASQWYLSCAHEEKCFVLCLEG